MFHLRLRRSFAFFALAGFFYSVVYADPLSPSLKKDVSREELPNETVLKQSLKVSSKKEKPIPFLQDVTRIFGVTYFSYFLGPGLAPQNRSFYPNQLGMKDDDGVYSQNQVSLRYKFSKNLALDFQLRFKLILNNAKFKTNFSHFRWESPRIGVSGVLMKGEDWDLTGSVNTDFPYFFPQPLSGNQARCRKILFTPGMFANLKFEPRKSLWSFFTVVSPRYFIYSDRHAAENQYHEGGYRAENKPELILSLQPTINYRLSEKWKLTFGATIEYRKQVISEWSKVFGASFLSNGPSQQWRIHSTPFYFGATVSFGPTLTLFPFVNTFPIAAQRVNAMTGQQASFWHVMSIGMWLRGTLF